MKHEYKEGNEARNNFNKAMTAIFQLKKEEVPRPQPKKRTKRSKKSGSDKG
jgi:hypothetical protein